MAKAEKDFAELLRSFNKRGVRYCIVGTFAVAFHAVPRYTKDMDLLVEPTEENGRRICRALKDFGFGSLRITPADFASEGRFIQLGYEPVRVDLITSIAGVSFAQAWKKRKAGRYGEAKVYFLSFEDLMKNKKASGRKQDLADLEILQKTRARRSLRRG
ncbi:MAG: hypothetical protein HYZ94_00525 [Candidatus Omnitrophica bacterium]|nr:hypothetical protein [Candidatus Omnitrophota bacterium]